MNKNLVSVEIRCVTAADADEIARLTTELGYAATTEEIAGRLTALLPLSGHYTAVAPTNNARLLGWVSAERRLTLEGGDRVEIVGLVVSADARRGGVGRALVAAAEAWAAGEGSTSIVVRSNIARSESHRLYGAMGYTRLKTQHFYVKRL